MMTTQHRATARWQFRHMGMAVVALVSLVILAGCAGQPAAAPTQAPATTPAKTPLPPSAAGTLRIGVLPITDVVPFYIAEQEGYFKAQGLNVELVPVASAAERDQFMATRQIDGQLNDLVSTVLFNAEQPRLKIVRTARVAFPEQPQFWILVPKDSPINSVQDLKGVEIAISQNSVIAYVTDRLLELEGLKKEDIKTTNVPQIPVRFELLSKGQLKAATLPDPLASLAILEGAKDIVDDSQHPEISQSVISFRSDVVAQRPDDVRRFLKAYDQAVQDIRTRPDQFRNLPTPARPVGTDPGPVGRRGPVGAGQGTHQAVGLVRVIDRPGLCDTVTASNQRTREPDSPIPDY
jgi:NitT/TauT family transport system substrate-binding protein